jgi:hypothetical protein
VPEEAARFRRVARSENFGGAEGLVGLEELMGLEMPLLPGGVAAPYKKYYPFL